MKPLLFVMLSGLVALPATAPAAEAVAPAVGLQIGSRKQLFIDERFVAEKRDVALVGNPPVKAGAIDVAAETAPCVVEHGGICHLYQGLNGRTSLWTSADGLSWEAHGPLAGIDDAGPMWTSINSVFIDPKDAEHPFKGLYERTPKVIVEPETGRNHVAPVPGGLYLCRSRDGITWDYLPKVAIPFTCDTHNQMLYDPWRDRSGSDGDIDCGLMMIGIGMLRRGDEIWQYCYGSRRTHETKEQAEKHGRKGEAIIRLVQRLDGFMSIDAGPRGGELTTPPMVFAGDRLVLNAACHGLGEIWVEVLDDAGRPIPGFTRADAISIDRNGTAQEVWWKQGPDVSALAGRPVRLRFDMRSAKLYAFQFTEQDAGQRRK